MFAKSQYSFLIIAYVLLICIVVRVFFCYARKLSFFVESCNFLIKKYYNSCHKLPISSMFNSRRSW